MTFRELLLDTAARLENSDSAFLDSILLLGESLGLDKGQILSHLPDPVEAVPPGFGAMVERRRSGESIAYILGRKEFYGREFRVDRRVLAPRPDTEILVHAALECGDFSGKPALRLHDVCTGSGAVAVSVAAERPQWRVSASDISADALEVAAINAGRLCGGRVALYRADLLEGAEGPFDIIAANPPYVSSAETDSLLSRGWREPRMAFDGGESGLDLISRIVVGAHAALAPAGFLLIEMDPLQCPDVRAMFLSNGYASLRVWKDLSGKDRVIGGMKP